MTFSPIPVRCGGPRWETDPPTTAGIQGRLPNHIVSKSSAGPVFTFTLAAVDGGTQLTMDAGWHLPVPVVGAPVEALIMKRSEKHGVEMLANIKAEVEGTAA